MAWVLPVNRVVDEVITAAIWNQDVVANPTALLPVGIVFVFNEGGGVLTAGGSSGKHDLEIVFKCDIERVTLLADQSGTIQHDLWKDTYANAPPTVADTITAAAKPALSAAIKYQDASLTGWTKAIAAGDVLRSQTDSSPAPASVTRNTMILKASRS